LVYADCAGRGDTIWDLGYDYGGYVWVSDNIPTSGRRRLFDPNGYLSENASRDLSYLELKSAIAERIMVIKQQIKAKEEELLPLKNYLSCLEHSDRTAWLLYKTKGDG
jgi:hypothetical protein